MVPVNVVILVAAVAAVLCGLIVFLIVRLGQASLREKAQRIPKLEQENQSLVQRNQELHVQLTAAQHDQAAEAEKVQWLTQAEQRLRDSFQSLATQVLRDNSSQLLQSTKGTLDQFSQVLRSDWGSQKEAMQSLVKPLNEELRRLDHHVRDLEQKREGAYRGLSQQVEQIAHQYRQLQETTTTLKEALRAPNVRGRWGEVQLRRIVELAGLTDHVDFEEQYATAEGRPDMVVHLPGQAILPVDAKAPMAAYLRAVELTDSDQRNKLMRDHAAALRKHIQGLAQKSYWKQFDVAPEFVALLVPYESGLSAAFAADPSLLDYALTNHVVVVSPATLLALLKVVAYGWMQLELTKNARAIAEHGRDFLERLRPFLEHLGKTGSSLNQAVERYNDAVGSLERRVIPAARRLQELGAGSGPLPQVEALDVRARSVEKDE